MDYYARLAKAQEAIESIRDTMEDPQEVQPLLVVGDMGEMELDALREQLEPAIEAETIKRDEWRAARKALEEELGNEVQTHVDERNKIFVPAEGVCKKMLKPGRRGREHAVVQEHEQHGLRHIVR